MIECKICGKILKRNSALISHLQIHKISKKSYIKKFGDFQEYSTCKICGKKISKNRIYCSNECKFSDKSYNKRRSIKPKKDTTKLLKCKICGWTTSDILNLGGHAKKHLKEKHNLENLDNFDLIDKQKQELFKCPLCNWTTVDLDNSSGWFTTHLKKKHNLIPLEFVTKFPEYRKLWKMYFYNEDRKKFLSNSDNYIVCKICNLKFKYLTNSHLKSHDISQLEYKKRYGEILSKSTKKILQENYSSGLGLYDGNYVSNAEIEIINFLKEEGIQNIISSERSLINPYELDIYLPDKKIAIEFNGLYWHSELQGKSKDYHLNKTIRCESKEIQLIHIFEDEWADKREIVKNRLKNILHLNDKKIYARKCQPKEIISKTKKEFLEEVHIQGNDKSRVKIGLFYENELISVMTFGGLRRALGSIEKDNQYELMRYATKYNVIGGASKLLKYFIREYKPEKIISYADRRWTKSWDNVYEKIGFNKVSDGSPNYWYLDGYHTRLHRFNFTKQKILSKMDGKLNLTEWENMQDLGFDRIWDCGSLKYEIIL